MYSYNWTIDSLSEHLFDNKCCSFLKYIFQKSYDQLSPHSRIIISSLSLLPVPMTGIFLSNCNKIDFMDARDSLSQLLEHGLITKKTGVRDCKLVKQIFEMSPLAKYFCRYKIEYGEATLKENIIYFLAIELTNKIYDSIIFSDTKSLQNYLDENSELIARFGDELNRNDSLNDARFKHARNIRFPRKRATEELIGFNIKKP